MTVRATRIENEWALLGEMASANRDLLQDLSRSRNAEADFFRLTLRGTTALAGTPPDLRRVDTHVVEFRFPGYFPAVPIEAFLSVPLFHPNVHPDNGFVCLWTRGSTGDTIVTALVRLQNVIGWRLYNSNPDHLMQPEALAWAATAAGLPFPCTPLEVPAALQSELNWRQAPAEFRRRLSEPD